MRHCKFAGPFPFVGSKAETTASLRIEAPVASLVPTTSSAETESKYAYFRLDVFQSRVS